MASLGSGGVGKYRLADGFELAKIDPVRMSARDDSWEHTLENAHMRQSSCLHDIECHVNINVGICFLLAYPAQEAVRSYGAETGVSTGVDQRSTRGKAVVVQFEFPQHGGGQPSGVDFGHGEEAGIAN